MYKYSFLMCAFLIGCTNANNEFSRRQSKDGTNGHSSLVVTAYIYNANCQDGQGVRISAGMDMDENGLLSLNEVLSTTDLCNGQTGTQGEAGINGLSSLVEQIPLAPGAICAAGGAIFLTGLDLNANGLLDDSGIQSSYICNGVEGLSAPPPFTPIALINPCGDALNRVDEVFIKLANGILLASFSDSFNGNNTRFSVLTSGNYVTTDGDLCSFSVDANGNIFNESHHN